MAIIITDDCINCGACEPECPNNAIYESDVDWSMSEGTSLSDDKRNDPISDEFYFIVPSKCTECKGFHDEPQCAAVCPVDCCLPDPDRVETEEILLARKEELHG
jgi:ferredoxin